MRIRFAVLFLAATLACVTNGPPRAAADGNDSKTEAAAVKAADAAVRTIIGDASKGMRAAAARAAGTIAALNRAAKTGKNIATLSGVPSSPGVKVSAEQRTGLLNGCVEAVALFDDERLAHCRGAYEAFAESTACRTLAETATLNRLPGTGGPPDHFTTGLSVAWEKSGVTVDRAVGRFQAALAKEGTTFTHVVGPGPQFTEPTAVTPPNRVTDVPVILRTVGDSDGILRVVVTYPGDTPAGDFRAANTSVITVRSDGTGSFGESVQFPGGEEGERAVFLYSSAVDATLTEGFVAQIVLFDHASAALRPATPVAIVSPGPCEPAGGGGGGCTPVVDADPTALFVFTVRDGDTVVYSGDVLGPIPRDRTLTMDGVLIAEQGATLTNTALEVRIGGVVAFSATVPGPVVAFAPQAAQPFSLPAGTEGCLEVRVNGVVDRRFSVALSGP